MKIPEGIAIEIVGNVIRVKGRGGELEKKFNPLLLGVKIGSDGELTVSFKRKENRALRAAKNAMEAHVRNMIAGVTKGFEKKLEVVFAHFPVSIDVKGKDVFIKNFLGEKVARKARIAGDAQVVVAGNSITIKGRNKEDVGQTANNIVRATKIRERDIRVFQDGVYYSE